MICSWTQRALAMGFSLCLSKKRPSHGPSVRLRWAFPPACRGKGRLMDWCSAWLRLGWLGLGLARPLATPLAVQSRSGQLRAVLGCCVAPRLTVLTF